MKIIRETITPAELKQMAAGMFGNLLKAVVDVEGELTFIRICRVMILLNLIL